MRADILVAVLVLVVAALVAADFFRRTDESVPAGPHDHVDRPARDAGREMLLTSRTGTAALSFEPAGTGLAGTGTGQAMPRQGSRGARKTWLVRARLSLLATVSAAAAALATAGVIRAAGALRSASFHSDVSSVRDGALVSAVVACIAVVIALAAGLWAAIALIRSVLRPLHQLRAAAAELAEIRLPDALRHISQGGDDGLPAGVMAVSVSSADEIGDVARAFDQVQGEMLRLAASEAGLRGKLSDMFVELSARGQSLVERQIRLIEELEQGEQDTERLAGLFRMDHIATRMRRYSQNLLVLAGRELPGRRNQPVTLVDVIRAAASEIEEYGRVSLSAQPGIVVSGAAASDVVHLIAELAENATSMSAAGAPVDITGRTLASGGVLVEVTDQGVGMHPDQMAQANWRLENPPATDLAVSRNMGLFVVGRLAARHGIKVRLQPATSGGLSALVWLPDAVAVLQDAAVPTGPGGLAGVGSRRGAHQAAAPGAPAVTDPDRGPAERDPIARSPWPAPTPADVMVRQPPAGVAVRQPPAANPVPGAVPGPRHAWPAGGPRPDLRPRVPARGHVAVRSQPPAAVGASVPDEPVGRIAGATSGPEAEPAADGRLPIYDAVESGWFANRGEQSGATAAAEGSWAPRADRGLRTADTVMAPSSDGVTTAGLPVRVPRANLVPGAISGPPAAAAAPRSATAARDRLAGLQRGTSLGREAAGAAAAPDGEDESS